MEDNHKSALPHDFLNQMESLLGEKGLEDFLKSMRAAPSTVIRHNPYKVCEVPAALPRVPWCEDAVVLEKRPVFTLDPMFHGGAYYVQEASSTFIHHILGSINVSGLFLDLCAAPGGKSTILSSFLGHEGLLVANEVIKNRSQILRENIIKWGLGNTVVSQNDPAQFSALQGAFDLVLVDAPCSGEGMFRKDPLAVSEWSSEHVKLCAGRQSRILEQAASLPRDGGYLIYATCTYNTQENEENIKKLVELFSYQPVKIPINKDWGILEQAIPAHGDTYYSYRFFPHLLEGEGLFVCVLKRNSPMPDAVMKKSHEFKHPFLKRTSRKALEEKKLPDITFPFEPAFYHLDEVHFAINSNWAPMFENIATSLNIKYFGTELGQSVRNQFNPAHAWALSVLSKGGYPTAALDLETALSYLKRETIQPPGCPEGWVLVKYGDLPLGWIKNLGSRSNNYYPKEWRVRMQ
ncbi:methyltransferase RsmF C-terminal domain-like protein [Negadavirga shengliensis]|uniref:tRNA/rRNA cytosine-C5-methylase n=1 Tax=Negadavirga shengliensis TaxID=1389218 RepID=A0ABV9SVU7_9BACT